VQSVIKGGRLTRSRFVVIWERSALRSVSRRQALLGLALAVCLAPLSGQLPMGYLSMKHNA
jgi:hypothetical protein